MIKNSTTTFSGTNTGDITITLPSVSSISIGTTLSITNLNPTMYVRTYSDRYVIFGTRANPAEVFNDILNSDWNETKI